MMFSNTCTFVYTGIRLLSKIHIILSGLTEMPLTFIVLLHMALPCGEAIVDDIKYEHHFNNDYIN